jgi:signal transduction histidine kinase
MKLRSKLALGFGSALMVCLAASYLLTETLSRSSAEFVRVARERMPAYANLLRIKDCHERLGVFVRQGLSGADPLWTTRRLDTLKAEMNLLYEGTGKLLDAMASYDPLDVSEMQKMMQELQTAGREALTQGQRAVGTVRTDADEANRVYGEHFRPAQERASRLIEGLEGQVARRLTLQAERLRGMAQARARFVGTVVLLILLLLMVEALSLGRYVTRRIERLREGADRLADGDLAARVKMKGKDELAQLGAAFDRMAELVEGHTRALATNAKRLEKEVADRTRQLAEKAEELESKNLALAQANEELLSLDAMKDEFVSVASHELRTPLMAMQGALSLLAEDVAKQETGEAQEFIALCQRNTNRLITLVEELLDLGSLDSGRIRMCPKQVRVAEVVGDVLLSLKTLAQERSLGLTADVPADLVAWADADRTAQILTNLISNGLKFTREGGIHVTAREAGGFVEVAVADTGVGIPLEVQPILFDRFIQVHDPATRNASGVGLGLAIAKTLVERQGGAISVTSARGHGSTFRFTLPQGPGEAPAEAPLVEAPVGQQV